MPVVRFSLEVRSVIFSRLIRAMSLDLQEGTETEYPLEDRVDLIFKILRSIEFYQSTFWLFYFPALLEVTVAGNAFLKHSPQSLAILLLSSVWFGWLVVEITQGYKSKVHNAILEEIGVHMLENLRDC